MSKVFERLLEKQIVPFIDSKISALLCAYRKNYNAEHALIRVTEKIRKTLDSTGVAGMISMDLSKAFDCMPHDLLIAKLNAYGFGTQSLRLIANYLSNRKQRLKIGTTNSSWLKTKTGVPQGSVLGPLLFNIFINDFIYIIKQSEVCNFADDNTIISCGNYSSPFEELLRKSNECTIHIKNLKKLMLEVYKCLKNENPSFMWNMFYEKSIQYNLRSKNLLMLPQTNTIKYGNDSVVFRGSILWNYLPNEIKSQASVCTFKKCIKSWSGGDCNCKICKQ